MDKMVVDGADRRTRCPRLLAPTILRAIAYTQRREGPPKHTRSPRTPAGGSVGRGRSFRRIGCNNSVGAASFWETLGMSHFLIVQSRFPRTSFSPCIAHPAYPQLCPNTPCH